MAISLLTAHGTAASSTSASVTLPAAIPASSLAYLVVVTSVASTVTPPGGWTVLGSASTTSQFVTLLGKSVGAADSSTTVTLTLGTSARWNTGVVVASGANLDVLTAATTTGTSGTTQNIPAVTPTQADCVDLVIGTLQGGSGLGAVAVTPSSGFTEDLDYSSAFGSASEYGVYAEHRLLVGQAGTAQTATTTTSNINCRAVMWRFTLAPGGGAERVREARHSAQVLTRAQASRARDARLSTQVLTHAPTKLRAGVVTMQVLTHSQAAPAGFDGWGIPL